MGITIMKYFSRLNRLLDWDKNKEKKLNQWSKNKLANSDVDIILCGHDRVPRKKQVSFGTYINLGSFYKHKTMAFYNNSAISLVCWRANTHSLNQVKSSCINE
jgi:UDP-2,3-diacylglucosamine pyrophosphatase LpxH